MGLERKMAAKARGEGRGKKGREVGAQDGQGKMAAGEGGLEEERWLGRGWGKRKGSRDEQRTTGRKGRVEEGPGGVGRQDFVRGQQDAGLRTIPPPSPRFSRPTQAAPAGTRFCYVTVPATWRVLLGIVAALLSVRAEDGRTGRRGGWNTTTWRGCPRGSTAPSPSTSPPSEHP